MSITQDQLQPQEPLKNHSSVEMIGNTSDPLAQFLATHYMATYNEEKADPEINQDEIRENVTRYVEDNTQVETRLSPDELREMRHIPNEMKHELAAAMAKICCTNDATKARQFFDEIVEAVQIDAHRRYLFVHETLIPIPQGNKFSLVAIGKPRNGLEEIDNTVLADQLRARILNINLDNTSVTTIEGSPLAPNQNRTIYNLYDNVTRTARALAFVDIYSQIIEGLLRTYAQNSGAKITNDNQKLSDISLLVACACVLPTIELAHENMDVGANTTLDLLDERTKISSNHPLYNQFALFNLIKFLCATTLSDEELKAVKTIRLGDEQTTQILGEIQSIDQEISQLRQRLSELKKRKQQLQASLN